MKQLLLFLWLLIPLSMTAQTPTEIKEYVNYQTLGEVFELFKSKYGLKINYKPEDVKDIKLTYFFSGTKPDRAVEICLRETPLSFLKDETGTFFIFNKQKLAEAKAAEESTRFKGSATRKNFKLTGIVKDVKSGEPLPFVNVVILGTTKGATTNVDGYFTILDVPSDTSGLEISYIGYKSKNYYLSPKTPLSNLLIELESQTEILDEVTVTAEREELLRANEKVSMLKLSPAKIAALPSIGEKDIMRSFQLMPGVSAANENSSGLYVRGGTPDQTLVLYDGFNVYHVEHLFGFFSAFNPNAVKDVQLYKGGFESKFGGRISSVAEITGKEGNSKGFNAGLDVGLLASNAFVEVPIGDKFTSMFAVRRSYQTALYQKIFDKYSNTSTTTTPAAGPGGGRFNFTTTTPKSYFYDLNGRMTYKPTQKDVLSLSLYNGTDDMDNSRSNTLPNFGGGGGRNFNFSVNDQTNWGNLGGSLKWSRKFSDAFYMNTLVSYSNYYSTRDRTSDRSVPDTSGTTRTIKEGTLEDNNLKDYSAKLDFEWKLNSKNQVEFGIGATQNDIKYTYAQNDTTTIIDRHTQGLTATAYVQDKIKLGKLSLLPGLRVSYFEPTAKTYLEPRFSATYELTPQYKLKMAYGQYNQFVKRVIREDILQGSRDFWVLADNEKLPVTHSTHYILGAAYENKDWLFDVEAYRKDMTGLSEYSLRIRPAPRSVSYNEKFAAGDGYANGIDFLIQKKYGKLNGWVSYSLAEVKYNFPDYGKAFYANQDVRHELKVVGIYKLKNWDFSATWIYASGRPYTAPTGGYQLTLLDGSTRDYITVTDKNGLRLPDYHRLDIAATLNFKSRKGAARSISASIFNLYNRTNTWYKEFQIESSEIIETSVNYLGITPNLSFSWRFR
ncbi:MAG: TonB-dependent receptor [Saprospiraceae bacterium]|nr:TonB-dependent receptor [Saprospiraceae bacterium]